MASYSPKLLEKKYNNWVKAQLAVLFTKEGLEPFVCNDFQQFQQKCLKDICNNNGLLSGTVCTSCCTENLVKCPTKRICNFVGKQCIYHKYKQFLPNGCPNRICNLFNTEIQTTHRYSGPSYKNTDATQWCRNYWEVAKCFMPPDGYKDKMCAAETDFNGIISVIINNKNFQSRVHENINNKNNIFEQARIIGRDVRHSLSFEVEDKDLLHYFNVLKTLLSDQGYLYTDTHAKNAKQKLKELENDTLVIRNDDVKKALDDVARAAQDKIKTEIDEQAKEYEKIRLEMIKRKQRDIRTLNTKVDEGVKKLKDTSVKEIGRLKYECTAEREEIAKYGKRKRKQMKEYANTQMKRMKEWSDEDKEKGYITARENLKKELIKFYRSERSTVPLSPLVEEKDTSLAGFYVMADMVLVDQDQESDIEERIPVESLRALFLARSKFQQNIYLSADAGFGKTSFSKYLAITWCQSCFPNDDKDLFEDKDLKALAIFDFLYLVFLRDSTRVCRIDEMIEQQIISKLPPSESNYTLQEVLGREKCLIILDGLDEWIHLKKELIKFYRSERSTVPLSPLVEEKDTSLAGFYVMPDMVLVDQDQESDIEERIPVESLRALFLARSKFQQNIYLSADAGFGKTSFSKYLAITWCQSCFPNDDKDLFEDKDLKALAIFDFLYLVFLRDSTRVCRIDEMIEQQIISKLPPSESNYTLQEVLGREKCLIILDGLDEWIHPDNNCSDQKEKIPHRYARDNCIILTTTRPWKLGDLKLKTSDINMKVELVQLSQDSTRQLEKNAIRKMSRINNVDELNEKTRKFDEVISSLGLKHMQTIPLLLMYITCLWCNKIPIGHSKLEVYINITEFLLSRTVQKCKEVHPSPQPPHSDIPEFFKKHNLCQKFFSFLKALAKLAYNTLFNEKRGNKLLFDASVADEFLEADHMELCLLSGILTRSTTTTFIERTSKVSFSHKTVQEFFAAIFISSQSNNMETVTEKCKTVQSILDMSIICEFLSRMNSEMMCEISAGFMSVINEDKKRLATEQRQTCTTSIIDCITYRTC